MTPIKIKPDPDCEFCNGEGTVYDSADYGSTTVPMPSTCECVLDQLPEGQEYFEIVHELEGDDNE